MGTDCKPSFEQVHEILKVRAAGGGLPPGVISAWDRFLRLTARHTDTTPVTLRACDQAIEALQRRWYSFGFKTQRAFGNWASLVRRAVRTAADQSPLRHSADWDTVAKEARDLAGAKGYNCAGLALIARLAQEDDRQPSAINDDWIVQQSAKLAGPERARLRRAVNHWNTLAALGHPRLSSLAKPSSTARRRRAEPSELPDSLNTEIDALLARLKNSGSKSREDPVAALLAELSPETISALGLGEGGLVAGAGVSDAYLSIVRRTLYRAAGVLIRTGVSASDLVSISRIVTPEAGAHLAVEIIKGRRVRNSAAAHTAIAVLQTVARTCGLDSATVALDDVRNSSLVKTPSVRSMGESRRDMLRQFDDFRVLLRWLDAPRLLEIQGHRHWRNEEFRKFIAYFECAVLVDILQSNPVRRRNLVEATAKGTTSNVQLPFDRSNGSAIVSWAASQTKNHRELRGEMPPNATRRLRHLLSKEVRSKVENIYGTPGSSLLFPGRTPDGQPAPRTSLSSQFKKHMTELGIEMTAHAARSLAVKILWDHRPDLIHVAAPLLGDTEEVVRRYYTEPNVNQRATQDYQRAISTIHEQSVSRRRR